MALPVGTHPAAQKNLLPLVLAISFLLMACGSGGTGVRDPATAPVFTSAPGTAATQDDAYSYQVSTQPAAGAVTLALASAPSGAALNGNTLTWTPSAAQSRVPNQFSITATNPAGKATQSWTVTPAGTISGSWVITYWSSTGPLRQPVGWSKLFPPVALIPQPDGSFQRVQGSGNSDGTFSIPNVPSGYYWLQPTPAGMYWTSSSTFDFSLDLSGNLPPGTITSSVPTTLDVNLSGLDPLQAGDQVAFFPASSPSFPFVFDASSPAGGTTLNAGQSVGSNVDFSQIDTAFLLQYEPATITGLTISVLGAEAMVSNLALSNGATNTITATLTPSPPSSFDLNVKGTAWAPLFSNAAPSQPTLLGSDLGLMAQPFLNGSQFSE